MSSFSLPAASGVVSLLNDTRSAAIAGGGEAKEGRRPSLYDRSSSTSSSGQSRQSVHGLGSWSSSDTGGKGSIASTAYTSLTDTSVESLESGKISEIHALRKALQNREGGQSDVDKRNQGEQTSSAGSSSPQDRKRKAGENLSQSHSRAGTPEQVLDQRLLAASPKPMEGGSSTESESTREGVPLNMHNATSLSETDSPPSHRASKSPRHAVKSHSTTSGKRRYPCSHPGCDKTFSTSGHAARHNRIHTGSKPYRCTFPGCNASFSRQDNSLQHYRTHVLHPKSRSSGSISERGASKETTFAHTPSAHPNGADSEADPTVRMGRKALEEGTAIAVVHEVVDRNGRKGEAVQRTVGQPKSGGRRASASTSRSDLKDHLYPHSHSDGMEDEEDGMSVGSWDHSAGPPRGVTVPPQVADRCRTFGIPPVHCPPPPFTGDRASYARQSMTYPPISSPPGRPGSYVGASNAHPSAYGHPTPSWYAPSEPSPGPPNGAAYYEQPRLFNSHGQDHAYPMQPRWSGYNNGMSAAPPPAAGPSCISPNTAVPEGHFVDQHKRSHSLGNAQRTRPYLDADIYRPRQNAVSMSSSPTTASSMHKKDMSTSPGYGPMSASFDSTMPVGMRRAGVQDLRLPLPSISKLPCSSDRSTTAMMTPTTPLDDFPLPHQGANKLQPSLSSSYNQNGIRTLPPLRSIARK